MLLASVDKLSHTTFKIEQSLEKALHGALLQPQVQDMYGLDFPNSDGLGSLNPSHLGSMVPTLQLDQPHIASPCLESS